MRSARRLRIWSHRLAVLAALALAVAGCADVETDERRQLFLASTTSTEDSGLFEVLIPAFEAAHPEHSVVVLAVGSGEALELGRRGDVDVLLVHSPAAEEEFVAEGYGTDRRAVMYNDYVLLGPPADPAGIRGMDDSAAALARISEMGAIFVSRGDDSGTHRKELSLWAAAGIEPGGLGYRSAGQGMGEVLRIADELGAYTLSDRGTALFLRDGLKLEVLVEGDERLHNPYGVIPVTGARNAEGAAAFRDWITGPEARALIAEYGLERFGHPLFVPYGDPAAEPSADASR